ncbi:MAG: hypothetical protein J7J22_06055 [Candidatus Verstraetearchaeota archaeon]|nr:hypothetical protein [Candidatus Verstraetearchaeota archaeon]RLE54190.1 MAG: hypothetical protein DRJ30_05580 [Candidatus Verstraetearchaeota archaeon]
MKTYIKIYGPPIVEALQALEHVAVEISKEMPEITFYDVLGGTATSLEQEITSVYGLVEEEAVMKHVERLVSKSGWTLGEYDFYFEWARTPTFEELKKLISKVDEALKPLGCRYTVTTK